MITKIEPGTDKLNLTINAEIDITQYDYPCASPHLDFEVDEKITLDQIQKALKTMGYVVLPVAYYDQLLVDAGAEQDNTLKPGDL